MSTHARPLAPQFIDALAEHARLAVQVFLVIAGFLAARTLAPHGLPVEVRIVASLRKRWIRLAVPYWFALFLALVAGILARQWANLPHTPAAPSAGEVLANALMLQDLLGAPALSAGFWYVAIDLQLFALMVLLMGALHRVGRNGWAAAAVIVGATASLMAFNTDPDWDALGLYFFGAYGLGAMAWWSVASRAHGVRTWLLVVLIAVLTAASLVVQWRTRILLAGGTACLLALFGGAQLAGSARQARDAISWLSDRSYALFLVHYPACLILNAAAERWLPHTPGPQALALSVTWVVSMLLSHLLFTRLERPSGEWISRRA